MADEDVFNIEEPLKALDNNMDLLKDITQTFIDDCPHKLETIRDAVASGDAERIHRAAHSFKGSISNFGRNAAFHAANKMNLDAREGKTDTAAADLQELEHEVEQFIAALRDQVLTA